MPEESPECVIPTAAPKGCLSPDDLAKLAVRALLTELELYPKPGLVSPVDNGAHDDMDYALMKASAECLYPYFVELAEAGRKQAAFQSSIVPIGIAAEKHMLEVTGGINTHRGAIFILGLLVAACASAGSHEPYLIQSQLLTNWGDALEAHRRKGTNASTHGANVFRKTGNEGVRREAALGFPSVFDVALPHARKRLAEEYPAEDIWLEVLFLLISVTPDTNLFHRGGEDGYAFAQSEAKAFLDAGGIANENWRANALLIHSQFTQRNLSPGGCADLLAATIFIQKENTGQIFTNIK